MQHIYVKTYIQMYIYIYIYILPSIHKYYDMVVLCKNVVPVWQANAKLVLRMGFDKLCCKQQWMHGVYGPDPRQKRVVGIHGPS